MNPDQLQEFLILDSHILYRVQQSDPVREPSQHLQNAFPHGVTRRWLSDVFREKDSEVTETLDCRQEDWDDMWLTLVTGLTGLDPSRGRRHCHLVF